MICLQQNIHAVIRMGESNGYVAECMEIAVVTQGKALDETSQNLANVRWICIFRCRSIGHWLPHPSLAIIFELQPEYA